MALRFGMHPAGAETTRDSCQLTFLYINLACYWLEAFSDLLRQIESSIVVESYMYVALLAVKSRTV